MSDLQTEQRPELTEEDMEAMQKLCEKVHPHPLCARCTGRFAAIGSTVIKRDICMKCGGYVWWGAEENDNK